MKKVKIPQNRKKSKSSGSGECSPSDRKKYKIIH